MCSIGKFSKEDCNKTTYTRSISQKNKNDIKEEDFELIVRRSGFIIGDGDFNICSHHEQLFLHKYTFNQKKCCDPTKMHKKAV